MLDAGNRQDVHSPFRYFMKKARNRKYDTDLDLAYLARLWEAQEQCCALSGRKMSMPRNSLEWEQRTGDPWKPSLDRIDPERGYLRGNVRFIAMIANLAKHRFTDDDVIEFCVEVARWQGTRRPMPG